MFQTMKIDMLSKMIPFSDFAVVEKISVDAVKYNYVAMKVDHLNGAVIFGNVVRHLYFWFGIFCANELYSYLLTGRAEQRITYHF